MPGKRKSSFVWRYFTDIGDFKAICNICKDFLSHRTTVSNLKKHLDRKHPLVTNRSEFVDNNSSPNTIIEDTQNDQDGSETQDPDTDSQVDKRLHDPKNNEIIYFEIQDSNDEYEAIEEPQDEQDDDDDSEPVFVEYLEHPESSPKRDICSPPPPNPKLRRLNRHYVNKEVKFEDDNESLSRRHFLEIQRLKLETLRERNLHEKEKARAQIDRDAVKVQERFVAFLEDIKPALIKFLDK